MPSINRRHFIAGAMATGAYLTTQSWSAVSSLAQTATKTFSGNVNIPEGFTVPAGETWEFDSNVSTTVVVEKNVVVLGTLRMRPSSASVVHTLRFENVDESRFVGGGMEVLDTDVGLWVMGAGRLDIAGTAKRPWTRSGWDQSWKSTDDVRLAPSASGDFGTDGFARFSPGDPIPSIGIPGLVSTIDSSFVDTAGSPFLAEIEAIARAGITTGYGDGRFGPYDGVSRAQMAAFLVRALELAPAVDAGFSDVLGHWAEDEINRLAAAGITKGYPDGRFGPEDGVTRAQMAAFLVRALGLNGSGDAGFSDVAGHWAEPFINQLAAAGITSGYGDGRFGPNDPVSRGQMAAFLARSLGLSTEVPQASPSSSLAAEILNLTRNVRIEGTEGGHTHVLIHSSQPQQISYAEIRNTGPQKDGRVVLGRYGLHFHHCGDGSRSSVVEGVVVSRSGSHAFVPHMSHGVTFLDCIAYQTNEEAFWWDVPDPSHDIVWSNCVAALVRRAPGTTGYRLAGFVLGSGDRNVATGCVAVGVHGRDDSAGFHWPELSNIEDGVWNFTDCVAHNNRHNGIFTWQNTGKQHVVDSFTSYRNGEAGIKHGAYSNHYLYQNATVVESKTGLIVAAHSKDDASLEFRSIQISDCSTGIRLVGTNGESDLPTVFRSVKVSDTENKLTIASDPDRSPRFDLFTDCEIEPQHVKFESAARGSLFRFERRDGSSWAMNGAGALV